MIFLIRGIVVCSIIAVGGSYAMQSGYMIPIFEPNDIKFFTGNVVAYATESDYFGMKEGYTVNDDANIKYGYVRSHPKELAQLLAEDNCPSIKQLDQSHIDEGALYMRHITSQEAGVILQAMNTNKAYFEYVHEQKIAIFSSLKSVAKRNK